jgi:predicted nucleic acid-binding protein
MTVLLDRSVLIALSVGDHSLNGPATAWFESCEEHFATCAITQGALVRHLMRNGWDAGAAVNLISFVAKSQRHRFWRDEVGLDSVCIRGVLGHRQVTDAYLAQLSRHHQGRLATFDNAMAGLHSDVAELVPTS